MFYWINYWILYSLNFLIWNKDSDVIWEKDDIIIVRVFWKYWRIIKFIGFLLIYKYEVELLLNFRVDWNENSIVIDCIFKEWVKLVWKVKWYL